MKNKENAQKCLLIPKIKKKNMKNTKNVGIKMSQISCMTALIPRGQRPYMKKNIHSGVPSRLDLYEYV